MKRVFASLIKLESVYGRAWQVNGSMQIADPLADIEEAPSRLNHRLHKVVVSFWHIEMHSFTRPVERGLHLVIKRSRSVGTGMSAKIVRYAGFWCVFAKDRFGG